MGEEEERLSKIFDAISKILSLLVIFSFIPILIRTLTALVPKQRETLTLTSLENLTDFLTENVEYSLIYPLLLTVQDVLTDYLSETINVTLWLDGWNYRKSSTVEGSTSGSVTDYQIKVIVHYGSGVDNGEHVYLNGKCNVDFSDIRFTDSDGTLLNYWIESKVDGDYAVIWVKIPYIPVSPNTIKFYIYYGKSDATSISDGNATFIFFDDFTVKDTSKWQFLGTYPPVIENGELKTSSSSGATSYVWSIPTFPCDKGYKMSVKGRSPSGGTWRGLCRLKNNGEISIWYVGDAGAELQYGCSYAGSGSYLRVASNMTLTHKHVAHFHPGIIVRWFYDGTKVFETTNPSYIFPLNPNIILKVEIGDAFSDSGYGTIYWDDFFIAKHIHPEPTITAWGIEESL